MRGGHCDILKHTGTRSNEDTEQVDRQDTNTHAESRVWGEKCLIDVGVRGVQRPGCSTGNKNRREPCFMLYILLISYNTAMVDKSGVEEEEEVEE